MRPIYNPVAFNPGRGGHAQGHLREAFSDAVDAFEQWQDGEPEPSIAVGYDETPMRLSAVAGLLWNCTDIMPGMLCQQINDLVPIGSECRQGSTYAKGARHLRALIATESA